MRKKKSPEPPPHFYARIIVGEGADDDTLGTIEVHEELVNDKRVPVIRVSRNGAMALAQDLRNAAQRMPRTVH